MRSSKRIDATEKAPTTTVINPVTTAPILLRISIIHIMSGATDRFHGEFAPSDPRVPAIEKFGTVLECMDGRPLRRVADYLSTSFGVRYLDTITAAGLVRHLAEDTVQTSSILSSVDISIDKHGSHQIAVVAHHDCAGNPVSDRVQKQQIHAAISRLEGLYPNAEVLGLWLNEQWIVERIRRA